MIDIFESNISDQDVFVIDFYSLSFSRKLEYNRYGCACGKNKATPLKLEWSLKGLCKSLLGEFREILTDLGMCASFAICASKHTFN